MNKGREYLEEIGYYAYLKEAEATLKPCPFCGGEPIYISGIHCGYDDDSGRIECQKCGAELYGARLYGYGMYDPTKSFEAWNTRYEPTCDLYVKGNMYHCDKCDYLADPNEPFCAGCGSKIEFSGETKCKVIEE